MELKEIKGLEKAYEVAAMTSTSNGRSPGGWIRLARVQGSASEPYVVAIRRISTPQRFQFGCGCPDWVYRKRRTGALCKHQRMLFQGKSQTRVWFYKAGTMFFQIITGEI